MTMAKLKFGPWNIVEHEIWGGTPGIEFRLLDSDKRIILSKKVFRGNIQKYREIFRLLSASPEMLEALKARKQPMPISGECVDPHPFGQVTATLSNGKKVDRYAYADAAIRKAEK